MTPEEIKRAIWDCGTDKSPSSDGFTFDSIRRLWHILGADFVVAILEFFRSSSFPKG